jgi:hypothetical protein
MQLPAIFPRRKILSIDIGGTLAKAAFYVPKDCLEKASFGYHERITKETIPSNDYIVFQ